jgi:hypothetical protein
MSAPSHALVGDRDQKATFGELAHGVVEPADIYIRKAT